MSFAVISLNDRNVSQPSPESRSITSRLWLTLGQPGQQILLWGPSTFGLLNFIFNT